MTRHEGTHQARRAIHDEKKQNTDEKFLEPFHLFSTQIKMDYEESQWRKNLPVVAITLAIIALTFQVFVLYPWHIQLSRQISRMT
jgi:hypothetical protein